MSAILKCADLSPGYFLDLVGNASFPRDEPVRLWVEGADGWSLAWWPGLTGRIPWCGAGRAPVEREARGLLDSSISGRIFAPSGELRWRTIPAAGGQAFRVVFLGSSDFFAGPLVDRSEELKGLQPSKGEVILWGQKTRKSGEEWIELRIPHRFRYPVHDREAPAGGRVGVKAELQQWRDVRGEPHFVQLCDLVAYQEK